MGVCDVTDGQCACKPNVGGGDSGRDSRSRLCDQCMDGFYGLLTENGFGCDHCQCDAGGTDLQIGQDPVCDKDSGNKI